MNKKKKKTNLENLYWYLKFYLNVFTSIILISKEKIMTKKNLSDFLSEANAEINSISAEEAKKQSNDILFIDVRDKHERDAEPVIEDALQLSRGMLEFYADKDGPYFNEVLNTEKKIVLFCTLGARGALATKTLKDMGYKNIYNLENGLQDWNK